jgi:hypothetical protein
MTVTITTEPEHAVLSASGAHRWALTAQVAARPRKAFPTPRRRLPRKAPSPMSWPLIR